MMIRLCERALRLFFLGTLAIGPAFLGAGCGSDSGKKVVPSDEIAPLISALVPDSGAVGDTIGVLGADFGATQGESRVRFGAVEATTSVWSDTRIDAIVPDGAVSGNVQVVVHGVASNGKPFQIGSAPPPPVITIDRLVPPRTVAADTVRVIGSGFGASQGPGQVTFAGAADSRLGASIVSWTETEIRALVPSGAADGAVLVVIGAGSSNGVTFSAAERLISYADDLIPLFESKGCIDCHSGPFATNNLRLESAGTATSGDSDHGPVVRPRDGRSSILYLKVTANPPFGVRMPQGCSGQVCVSADAIRMISDWIDQGARDN